MPAATFAVFGFLAPVVTRRYGLERTATAALGLSALSLVLRALSPTPAALVASTVLALAGIGAANVVLVPLIKAWFADRIALWTSSYLLLMQTGQFVAPLLAVPVAEAAGWRVSVGIWAVPAAVAAVVWFVLAVKLPADHHVPAVAATPADKLKVGRSSTVWGLVVLFAHDVAVQLQHHHVGAGGAHRCRWERVARRDDGRPLLGVGRAAALVVPQVATRMRNPFVVVVACSVVLVLGYVGLAVSPLDGTVLWVCALGIGVSTFPLCMTLINHRTRTPQSASTVSGFVQGIGYGLACLGPIGLGLLREATGSWTTPLVGARRHRRTRGARRLVRLPAAVRRGRRGPRRRMSKKGPAHGAGPSSS